MHRPLTGGTAARRVCCRTVPAIIATALIAWAGTVQSQTLTTDETAIEEADRLEASLPAERFDSRRAAQLPHMLSRADEKRYRDIFTAQKAGDWRAADRLIRQLDDPLLLGHVMAQRYLHPTRYRSRFSELRDWLADYADHPEAGRIYRLAMKRKPAAAAAPRAPRSGFTGTMDAAETAGIQGAEATFRPARSLIASGTERRLRRRIATNVAREILTASERILDDPATIRAVGQAGADRTRALVAAGWFRRGDVNDAWRVAKEAADRSGKAAPRAHWWAGLAGFRLGKFAAAARHFEIYAEARGQGSREAAAGFFWAARSHLVGGKPDQVAPLLSRAAAEGRTFYGLLSARMLGGNARFDWSVPELATSRLDTLGSAAPAKRALALVQVGQVRRAEAELRRIRMGASPGVLRTVIAVAEAAGLPSTAMRAGHYLATGAGERFDAALYPVLSWSPRDGYLIDRALLNALARQESGFNAYARSPSGARGLMQLMPSTARYMANGTILRRNDLYEPELNLALGQKYVDYLLAHGVVGGDVVRMLAAYNAGPGNLAKWQRSIKAGDDPLIFIETIPVRETRLFVQRVLENLWIYRSRLGQNAPTLDALAAGEWPRYVGLDGTELGVAEQR